MNEQLYEMMFKRNSFHLFLNVGNDSVNNANCSVVSKHCNPAIG